MLIKVYHVEGMTTTKCKEKIEQYVSKLQHVRSVEANVTTKQVQVTTERFIEDKVGKLLIALGYTLKEELPDNNLSIS